MVGSRDEYALAADERALAQEERMLYEAQIEAWRQVLQQLMAVDIANMTPLQALNVLNEMQMAVRKSRLHGPASNKSDRPE